MLTVEGWGALAKTSDAVACDFHNFFQPELWKKVVEKNWGMQFVRLDFQKNFLDFFLLICERKNYRNTLKLYNKIKITWILFEMSRGEVTISLQTELKLCLSVYWYVTFWLSIVSKWNHKWHPSGWNLNGQSLFQSWRGIPLQWENFTMPGSRAPSNSMLPTRTSKCSSNNAHY